MNGTATCGERVVLVKVDSGHVNLKTGQVLDPDVDNVQAAEGNAAVAWANRQGGPVQDAPDEVHERSVQVDDIHLLKADEVASLHDREEVNHRFGEIYQDGLLSKIHRALKRLKTG